MRHGAWYLLLLCGCLGPNPEYLPGQKADMGQGGECRSGERRCDLRLTYWESQSCHRGQWTDDRRCPHNSECMDGYCQAPPMEGTFEGKPCLQENDCFELTQSIYSCQPFVHVPDGVIEYACAQEVGTALPGTPCTTAAGSRCRSGFCDEVGHPAGNGTNYCFRLCGIATDCPSTARLCEDARITVEQVQDGAVKSCVPGR